MNNVIVISGKPYAGSSTSAQIVASRLGFQYFSPGRLFKDIGTGVFRDRDYFPLFEELCRKRGVELPANHEAHQAYATLYAWKDKIAGSEKFHRVIEELQIELAKRGCIVLDGKLSVRMIPNPNLKVWLNANLETRAERLKQRDDPPRGQEKDILTQREEVERRRWKEIYGFDYFDQERDADLVIDTTHLDPEKVADEIINAYSRKITKL